MNSNQYNEALARLGAAAGLILTLDLDALDEQALALRTLVDSSLTDDEGRALGDDERTELRDSLAGIKAMIDAARSFRATLATSGCDLEALAASYRTPHQ